MLRYSLPLGRSTIVPGRAATFNQARTKVVRQLANSAGAGNGPKASIKDPRPPVLPGSESKTAPAGTPPPPGAVSIGSPTLRSSPSSSPTMNVPLIPPTPPGGKTQTSPPISIPPSNGSGGPSQSPPPKPKAKPRRLRRFLLAMVLLSVLGFGGGVWASLLSDNFHDFFTEYIPFGEEVVLYFEEREFRKRFPNALNATHRRPVDAGEKITIPTKSGLSSKVTDPVGSDLSTKGPHMSAVGSSSKDVKETPSTTSAVSSAVSSGVSAAKQGLQTAIGEGSPTQKKEEPKKPKAEPVKAEPPAKKSEKITKSTKSPEPQAPTRKTPAVDEPSVYVPLSRLDPLNIKDADEPLVQDLVKMLNDIIIVANADNATGKFNTSIAKAKSELSAVGQKIKNLKVAEKEIADDRVNATRTEFDNAARELVSRLEGEMEAQESQWRGQLETEKQKLSQEYRDRLSTEIEQASKLLEEKTRNQLLEQAVALKKHFSSDIKSRVEHERNGRLGQLSELSASHKQLEKLTADWNSILEMNLKTQHLQVAVQAVRAGLERTDRPRPFVRELAALKELAEDDGVVNSAIASINPTAYQLGIPTSAQLIDRFRRVADEVRKASLLPDNAGIASHAASFFLSKMMFKKQGISAGNDVESVLTRAETLLDEGNFDQAAREVNNLDGWAKTLSKDWLADVRKVLEVRQALDVMSTEARLQSLKVD